MDFRKQGHDLLGLWIAFERCEECFYAVQACLPVGIFRQLPPAFSEHLSWQKDTIGRVSDVHCGLATLHDLVGVTAGTKHRNAYQVALLQKKASAWHGEW